MPVVGIPARREVPCTNGQTYAPDYGARGDARAFNDGSITATQTAFTSSSGTAAFTSADVGKTIVIAGAGTSSAQLTTTIAGYTDASHVTLATAAGTTVSSAYCAVGTDNTSALQKALNDAVGMRYTDGSGTMQWGAFADASMTASSATLTTSTTVLDSSMVGKLAIVAGAGSGSPASPLYAQILSVSPPHTATLSASAVVTVSGASCTIQGGGGSCFIPAGCYLTTGVLLVPQFCAVTGIQGTPLTCFPPQGPPTSNGTSIWVTNGAGSGSGTSFFTLQNNSSAADLAFFHPCQPKISGTSNAPIAYPFTVLMTGYEATLEKCGFWNPYQAIYFLGQQPFGGGRPTIKDIRGQPYSVGLQVDYSVDTARIENISWVYSYDGGSGSPSWTQNNGVAFQFYRCDDLIGEKLFCLNYQYGYKFDVTSGAWGGAPWARFLGCGADQCTYGVYANKVHTNSGTNFGVEFSNCNLTSCGTMAVTTTSTMTGPLSFVGGKLCGPNGAVANLGSGSGGWVKFNGVTHVVDLGQTFTGTAFNLTGGGMMVDGCVFQTAITSPGLHADLASSAGWCQFTNNRLANGSQQITNNMTAGTYTTTPNLTA